MRRNTTRSGVARRNRKARYAIKQWVDRLIDTPAFIIGNAPSINDFNLAPLEDYFTIGINRAFYLIDPTILMWQDVSLWTSEYHKLHNTQALKVARDIADPRRIYYNFSLKGGNFKFDVPKKTHIMYGRGTTGPLAVQLAFALGCRPIILLGMDCKRDEKTGHGDFYGENKHWLPHTLDNCDKGLKAISESCPVEIISCGNSKYWPRQELKDVLKNIDPKHKRNRSSYVRQILRSNES